MINKHKFKSKNRPKIILRLVRICKYYSFLEKKTTLSKHQKIETYRNIFADTCFETRNFKYFYSFSSLHTFQFDLSNFTQNCYKQTLKAFMTWSTLTQVLVPQHIYAKLRNYSIFHDRFIFSFTNPIKNSSLAVFRVLNK